MFIQNPLLDTMDCSIVLLRSGLSDYFLGSFDSVRSTTITVCENTMHIPRLNCMFNPHETDLKRNQWIFVEGMVAWRIHIVAREDEKDARH